jgi:hypothetical protein
MKSAALPSVLVAVHAVHDHPVGLSLDGCVSPERAYDQ